MAYKLGKRPASPLKKKAIKFGDVFNLRKLPQPALEFGVYDLIDQPGMYGNDEWGDCVWVTKANMHGLWSRMGQHRETRFTTENVLSDYAAQTGFDPSNTDTDQGTDMKEAAEYHRKIGVVDRKGIRRRVTAYVNLTPGNMDQLAVAASIFGAVEIGTLVTNDNFEQFDAGKPWRVTSANPVGGHCVPIVGRDGDGNFLCWTWGKLQPIEPAFLVKYMDEGICYLAEDILNRAGRSTAGALNRKKLDDMLRKVSPANQVIALNDDPAQEHIRYGAMAMPQREPNDDQFEVAFRDLRAMVDKTGYGWMVNDDDLRPASEKIARDIVQAGDDPVEATETENV